MIQTSITQNNAGKSMRYAWDVKVIITLLLVGFTASIYALVQVMMEWF